MDLSPLDIVKFCFGLRNLLLSARLDPKLKAKVVIGRGCQKSQVNGPHIRFQEPLWD